VEARSVTLRRQLEEWREALWVERSGLRSGASGTPSGMEGTSSSTARSWPRPAAQVLLRVPAAGGPRRHRVDGPARGPEL